MRKWIDLCEDNHSPDGNQALLAYFEERPVDISDFVEEWRYFIDGFVSEENIKAICDRFGFRDKSEIKPHVYYELSPKGRRIFADWLEAENITADVLHRDPQSAPAWMLLEPTREGLLPATTRIIHLTDHAQEIAHNGFENGVADPDRLALTIMNDVFGNQTRAVHDGPGYNFGYRASDYDFRNRTWKDGGIHRSAYGKQAVLVQSSGIEVYHAGDRERQIIFWGPTAKVLKVFTLENAHA